MCYNKYMTEPTQPQPVLNSTPTQGRNMMRGQEIFDGCKVKIGGIIETELKDIFDKTKDITNPEDLLYSLSSGIYSITKKIRSTIDRDYEYISDDRSKWWVYKTFMESFYKKIDVGGLCRDYNKRISDMVDGLNPNDEITIEKIKYQVSMMIDQHFANREQIPKYQFNRDKTTANELAVAIHNAQGRMKDLTSGFQSKAKNMNAEEYRIAFKELHKRYREVGLDNIIYRSRALICKYWRPNMRISGERMDLDIIKIKAISSYRIATRLNAGIEAVSDSEQLQLEHSPVTKDEIVDGAVALKDAINSICHELSIEPAQFANVMDINPSQSDKKETDATELRVKDVMALLEKYEFVEKYLKLKSLLKGFYRNFWNDERFRPFVYRPRPINTRDGKQVKIHGIPQTDYINREELSDSDLADLVIEANNKYRSGIQLAESQLTGFGMKIAEMKRQKDNTGSTPITNVTTMDRAYIADLGTETGVMLFTLFDIKNLVREIGDICVMSPAYKSVAASVAEKEKTTDTEAKLDDILAGIKYI